MKNAPTKRNVNLIEMSHLHHYGIGRTIRHGNYGTWLDDTCNIEGHGVDIVEMVSHNRATCRITGEKIPRGTKVITGLYDFTGAGSYTCQKIYISLDAYKQRIREDKNKYYGERALREYREGLSS